MSHKAPYLRIATRPFSEHKSRYSAVASILPGHTVSNSHRGEKKRKLKKQQEQTVYKVKKAL